MSLTSRPHFYFLILCCWILISQAAQANVVQYSKESPYTELLAYAKNTEIEYTKGPLELEKELFYLDAPGTYRLTLSDESPMVPYDDLKMMVVNQAGVLGKIDGPGVFEFEVNKPLHILATVYGLHLTPFHKGAFKLQLEQVEVLPTPIPLPVLLLASALTTLLAGF
ncbi:MAG TPA: hypothetical protein DCZ03_05135, partial [Gammaproteobacteria bacterium]|nr:hypothetical protein [Gammaproteobacteria bacterium]